MSSTALDFAALTAPCNAAFGDRMTFLPASGGSFDILGVYDAAYTDVSFSGDGTAVTSTFPIVGIQPGDLPAPPAQDDRLIWLKTGELFEVRKVRDDSHGWAILELNFIG